MFDWITDAIEGIIDPIVDGILSGIIDIFFTPLLNFFAWIFANIILKYFVAMPLWNLNKILILIGVGIAKFTEVLIDELFVAAFDILAVDVGMALLPLVFTIALTLLGMTYVLAAFWMRSTIVVDWKKAIAWLIFAYLFYTYGSDIFVQSYILERSLGTVLYDTAFSLDTDNIRNSMGPFISEFNATDVPPADREDMFGQGGVGWLKYDDTIDGIDVAMAYFLADVTDITNSNPVELPSELDDAFWGDFDAGDLLTNEPADILDDAIAGVLRLFFGIFICVFGILDEVVSLWIALGLALTFFMLLWCVLLAFFNATEPIAKHLVRSWLDFMLLALFSGIIKAVGIFVLLLAATIPHPAIWTAGAALALAVGWFANKNAIDGVQQLMKNIQASVTSFSLTGFRYSAGLGAPAGFSMMGGGGMGGMGGGMGGMGGGAGGMAAMNPKMMAAQAALGFAGGAFGGSAGQRFATNPMSGIRSIMSPSYNTSGGMPMHADIGATEGMPQRGGAAFGAAPAYKMYGSQPTLSATSMRPPLTPSSPPSSPSTPPTTGRSVAQAVTDTEAAIANNPAAQNMSVPERAAAAARRRELSRGVTPSSDRGNVPPTRPSNT